MSILWIILIVVLVLALLGFFGMAQPRDVRYTKYIIVDEVNLKHRAYPAARGRQAMRCARSGNMRAPSFMPRSWPRLRPAMASGPRQRCTAI